MKKQVWANEALYKALQELEVRSSTLLISTSKLFFGSREDIEEDRKNLSAALINARAVLLAARQGESRHAHWKRRPSNQQAAYRTAQSKCYDGRLVKPANR